MSKLKVCLRHISEVFLYEFYCLGDDEYEISDEDTLTPHKEKAKEQFMNGELQVVNNLLLLPSKSDNVGHRKYFMYLWRYVRNE